MYPLWLARNMRHTCDGNASDSLNKLFVKRPTRKVAGFPARCHEKTVSAFQPDLAAGDFNGDGKVDLVVSNDAVNPGMATVSILLGNGDGTFRAPVSYLTGSGAAYVAVGDFNGDGKLDVAAVASSAGWASCLATVTGPCSPRFNIRPAA